MRARQVAAGAELLLHVVGQALGALADRAIVDRVGADRVHPPAPAAGAEGNDRPEDVVERLPLARLDHLGHLRRRTRRSGPR